MAAISIYICTINMSRSFLPRAWIPYSKALSTDMYLFDKIFLLIPIGQAKLKVYFNLNYLKSSSISFIIT